MVWLLLPLPHFRVRVIQIAEADRLRRTCLLAGRLECAIGDRHASSFAGDLGRANTLNAVGTFLHHTPTADGDFRVTAELECVGFPVLKSEEIESANFVRAAVRTVSRPDTTVVDHVVEAIMTVHGRPDGTNVFTRRILAVHTWHRLKELPRVGDVAVDANPVHLACAQHLLLANHRTVVLALTGHHAR